MIVGTNSNNSVIWKTVCDLSFKMSPAEVHQWLQNNLVFWPNNQFDHEAFVSWYGSANFQDREIVYRYLKPHEQNLVLKTWHQQMPAQPIVTQFQKHTHTNFLDGQPPIRELPKLKDQKGAYTKF